MIEFCKKERWNFYGIVESGNRISLLTLLITPLFSNHFTHLCIWIRKIYWNSLLSWFFRKKENEKKKKRKENIKAGLVPLVLENIDSDIYRY